MAAADATDVADAAAEDAAANAAAETKIPCASVRARACVCMKLVNASNAAITWSLL